MLDQVRGGLGHAPGVARWTQPPPLAGEGHQDVVAALGTSGAGEALGKNAALKRLPKLPLNMCRHRAAIPVVFPCEGERGLPVLLNEPVERCVLRTATGIRNGSTSL
jgi:hypothetical protein